MAEHPKLSRELLSFSRVLHIAHDAHKGKALHHLRRDAPCQTPIQSTDAHLREPCGTRAASFILLCRSFELSIVTVDLVWASWKGRLVSYGSDLGVARRQRRWAMSTSGMDNVGNISVLV
ncbi:hypothetical protein J1614_011219 [Plenodomus biglobosus]|nr:hypothetical protein J1614_011219 [Plenodomus biglobosus]